MHDVSISGLDSGTNEIEISSPYSEIDSESSSNIFSPNTSDLALPSPSKFSRPQSVLQTAERKCCCGAIISIIKPYRILAASSEFLRTVEFSSDQICGRSINMILGPKTNNVALIAAIKNTAQFESRKIEIILSASSGRDVNIAATFSPYRNPLDGNLGGCLFQIDVIHSPDLENFHSIILIDDLGLSAMGRSAPEQAARRRIRREANAAAGLDNEEERQRQRSGSEHSLPSTSIECEVQLARKETHFHLIEESSGVQEPFLESLRSGH